MPHLQGVAEPEASPAGAVRSQVRAHHSDPWAGPLIAFGLFHISAAFDGARSPGFGGHNTATIAHGGGAVRLNPACAASCASSATISPPREHNCVPRPGIGPKRQARRCPTSTPSAKRPLQIAYRQSELTRDRASRRYEAPAAVTEAGLSPRFELPAAWSTVEQLTQHPVAHDGQVTVSPVTSCERAVIPAVDPGNASNPTVKELAMHSLIRIDLARTLAQERARQIPARSDGRDHDRSRAPRYVCVAAVYGLRLPFKPRHWIEQLMGSVRREPGAPRLQRSVYKRNQPSPVPAHFRQALPSVPWRPGVARSSW